MSIANFTRHPVVAPPITYTLLEQKEEKTDRGVKYSSVIQSVGANGVTSISRSVYERVESRAEYKGFLTTTVLWYPPGASLEDKTEWVSTYSHMVSGVKGEVKGNRRTDLISTTTMDGKGSTIESGPRSVDVYLDLPEIRALPFQEQMKWLENYIAGKKHSFGSDRCPC